MRSTKHLAGIAIVATCGLLLAPLAPAMAKSGEAAPTDPAVVDNTGAARLRIPIEVPPGPGGFAPKLELVYSSSSGDGPYGIGWSLGIPEIRCSDRFGVPNYADCAKYELGSDLLVEETEPENQNKFHTLLESFQRIRYDPADDFWTVEQPNGTKLIFGELPSHRISQGGSTARWLLQRMEDFFGNQIFLEYDTPAGTGWPYLKRVFYGAGATAAEGPREIRFEYQDRPDVRQLHSGGIARKITKRLREVLVFGHGEIFKRYAFGYDLTLQSYTADRTRLSWVQEFGTDCTSLAPDGFENCTGLPRQEFRYSDASDGYDGDDDYRVPLGSYPVGASRVSIPQMFGDINGDGLPDRMALTPNIGNQTLPGTMRIWMNTGSGFSDGDESARDYQASFDGLTYEQPRLVYEQIPAPIFGNPSIELWWNPWSMYAMCSVTAGTRTATLSQELHPRGVVAATSRYSTLTDPAGPPYTGFFEPRPSVKLVDLDADGLADLVVSVRLGGVDRHHHTDCDGSPQAPPERIAPRSVAVVFRNTGSGWENDPAAQALAAGLPPFEEVIVKSSYQTERDEPTLFSPNYFASEPARSPCANNSYLGFEWNDFSYYSPDMTVVCHVPINLSPQFVDFNGDGLLDIAVIEREHPDLFWTGLPPVLTPIDRNRAQTRVWIQTPNGPQRWARAQQFDLPPEIFDDPLEMGLEFAHVWLFHDAFSELTGIDCYSSLVTFWECGPNTYTVDLGVRLADVNGDGLADVVWNSVGANCPPRRPWDPPCSTPPTGSSGVLLNTGGGSERSAAWCASNALDAEHLDGRECLEAAVYVPPGSFISRYSETGFSTEFPITTGWLRDLNGDGLLDFVTGRVGFAMESWIQSPSGTTPSTRWRRDEAFDFGINWSRTVSNPFNPTQQLPVGPDQYVHFTPGIQIFDINGDGSADFVSDQHAKLSLSHHADLLESVENGRGGDVYIEYKPATGQRSILLEEAAADDVAPQRPDGGDAGPWSATPVVFRVTVSGPDFATATTEYHYARPRYWSDFRADLGFRLVEQTRPDGSKVEKYFYQDLGRAGHVSRQLVKDAGQVVHQFVATWENVPSDFPGTIPDAFVGRLTSEVSVNRYANEFGAELRRTYLYDDEHGYNFVREIRTERPTGTLTDERIPVLMTVPGPYLVGRIDKRTLKDGNATLRDTAFTYQDLGGNPTGPKLGSRTEFIGARGGTGAYVTVALYRYDGYGNLTEEQTPRPGGGPLRSTLLCYDGDVDPCPPGPSQQTSHSVVVSSKDPAGKFTRFTPDSRSGIVVATGSDYTDEPDRRVTLDPFGRPEREFATPHGGSEVIVAKNSYSGAGAPLAIERREYVNGAELESEAIRSAEVFGSFGGIWKRVTATPSGFAAVVTFRDPVQRRARTTLPLDCEGNATCSQFSGQTQELAREVTTDVLGRPVRIDTPDGFSTLTYRGVDGRWGLGRLDAVLERNPKGDLLDRAFDGDRVVWVDECHGNEDCDTADTTRYTYEATGEIRTIYDPRAVEGTTSNFSDPNHRLSYAYDTLGRVVRIEDPDLGGDTPYTENMYSDAGNLTVTTNARGQSRTLSYDILDRLTEVDAPPGEDDYTIEYRPTEWQRAKDFSPAYERVRTYDGWGRVERTQLTVVESGGPIIGVGTFFMDFEFDLAGRPVEVTYPESTKVRYEYEGAYLKRVCDLGDAEDCSDSGVVKYVSSVEHDEFGRRETTTTAAGTRTFEYDGSLPRLTRDYFETLPGAPEPYFLDLIYQDYDELGNLTRMTGSSLPGDIDLDQEFTYDQRNRVASWKKGLVTHAYGFDDLGNLTNNAGSTQAFNAATRPHAVQHRANGNATYTHDPDGNVTAILAASGNRYFKFDSASRMVCADSVEGGCALNQVHYDVDGRRVLDDDPMAWQYRAFVDDSVSVEAGIFSAETRIEIHAFGERVAFKRSEAATRTAGAELPFGLPPAALELLGGFAFLGLLAWLAKQGALVLVIQRPGYSGVSAVLVVALVLGPVPGVPVSRAGGGGGASFYWELADPLGTGMVMLDETGARRVHRTYSPFGVQQASVGPASWLPRHYAGHLEDEDSGLIYMQARWMDAQSGTFLSIDPVVADAADPQAFNAYAYARNNPASYWDPTGAWFESLFPPFTDVPLAVFSRLRTIAPYPQPASSAPYSLVSEVGGLAESQGGDPGEAGQPGIPIPPAPDGVSVDENIKEIRRISTQDPEAALIYWLNNVRPYGPQDYKRQGQEFEPFGNFNYGATGRALGIPGEVLLRAAGAVQVIQERATGQPAGPGSPFGNPPYGDYPRDQFYIRQGIEYFNRNYYGTLP